MENQSKTAWRRQNGRKKYLGKSTAKRHEGRRACSRNTVRAATTSGRTGGRTQQIRQELRHGGFDATVSTLGTDPGQFEDLRRYAITKQLATYIRGAVRGQETRCRQEIFTTEFQSSMMATALSEAEDDRGREKQDHEWVSRVSVTKAAGARVYKAAPRDGIWATPPFMHNGSVPNFTKCSVPAKERTKKFYIGREFDPVKVGVRHQRQPQESS